MTLSRFKSDVITQDDVDAYLRSKDIQGRPTENQHDLREVLPIISAIYRNQIKTSGKLEF